ncbi:MAG: hypothetical protein U0V87_11800 [Acidobacteriota bacterium]
MPARYRALDPAKITATAEALRLRVNERFDGSGLSRVAGELVAETHRAADLSRWLAAPMVWLRVLVGLVIVAMLAALIGAATVVGPALQGTTSLFELLQGLESGINDLVFMGIGVYFLVGIEERLKRKRALQALHVLRSMAHIIDMHQLTKDPDRALAGGPSTDSSPPRTLSPFELGRYLDYCSEMLAIISKSAALHVQDFRDPVTLAAVDEVEGLTTGLSRKIWQKIMILDRQLPPHPGHP